MGLAAGSRDRRPAAWSPPPPEVEEVQPPARGKPKLVALVAVARTLPVLMVTLLNRKRTDAPDRGGSPRRRP